MAEMFDNHHLELMEQRAAPHAWRAEDLFTFPDDFDQDRQDAALNFMLGSPETGIRQAQLWTPRPGQLAVSMIVEGRSCAEALENVVTGSEGGLLAAGLETSQTARESLHLAWLWELHIFPGVSLIDSSHDMTNVQTNPIYFQLLKEITSVYIKKPTDERTHLIEHSGLGDLDTAA